MLQLRELPALPTDQMPEQALLTRSLELALPLALLLPHIFDSILIV